MSLDLKGLKEKVESLNQFHQIEILRILNNHNIMLNENKNGVFINLTNIDSKYLVEIEEYLKYVTQQESQLNEIERQKSDLSNKFFK